MTRAEHISGTDRVAEVASAFEDIELVVIPAAGTDAAWKPAASVDAQALVAALDNCAPS